ncbi:MAG: Flp pilus assembly complex ATPase component TadA, partial [Planctomycetales bacterium]|nr:Flp pilus assembly complex ATPase component TadA [Planctomycetales bacterium]
QVAAQVVARIKVLARLLTYESHVPQEGRLALEGRHLLEDRQASEGRLAAAGHGEARVSTFPTLFGEKVVIRHLSASGSELSRLDTLGLPTSTLAGIRRALAETSGAVLIVGPAGSGKTTTAYACLRHVASTSAGGRSIASLEDPVEVIVPGVAQSQIAPSSGFDMATGLRSLVRQDPEVILLGEIRDEATARIAMQAALTGQLLLTTFHANDSATAVSRLADMDIAPYAIRSAVRAVVDQRLVRKLCECAAVNESHHAGSDGASQERVAVGCESCAHTGYSGRLLVTELLSLDEPLVAEAVLRRADAVELRGAAIKSGMRSLDSQVSRLIAEGLTSRIEAVRCLGLAAAEG